MRPIPNPEARGLAAASHGALDFGELARLGLRSGEVVDFSASVNPHGPAPKVIEAARAADISEYPDRECRGLRAAISGHTGVEAEGIVCGNGSAELIDHLARCYLAQGDTAFVVGPTFSEYERASLLRGVKVTRFDRTLAPDGATLDVGNLSSEVQNWRPRVVWLCSPNNPTGDLMPRADVEAVLEAVFGVGGLLVVDEAYRDLVLEGELENLTELLSGGAGGNIVLLRSMTKAHALAGLRLGYALSDPEVISALAAVQPPWSVSGPAQDAGAAALSPPALSHLEKSRGTLARDAAFLRRELSRLGLSVLSGVANYLLVDVSGSGGGAAARGKLLAEGLQVRDCASFGLPEHIRVSVRRREECELLVSALERLDRGPG
ncbi:MAG: pyridoxal phosphate-dependent aminotransferase [Rubrobacteraceae bacterium]